MTKLSPAQQSAFDHFLRGLSIGSVFRFWAGVGRGKSTVIREAHAKTGGALITAKDFLQLSAGKHPLALEETLFTLGVEALNKNDVVYIDDFHLIDICSGGCHFYPRSGFSNSVANALCSLALDSKKKLVFATNSNLPDAAVQRSYSFGIDRFKREDYAALARVWLPEKKAAAIDFEKVYRFAPKLNAHQIKAACLWLADDEKLGTERFIDYLRYNRLASNVDLGEVQEVDLRDLRGVEDVIRNLEINIVHPLENDTLATELGLRSKHGVLLYGPPGTGKTTVGRALAR